MAQQSKRRARAREDLLVLTWRDPWHPEGGGSERWMQEVTTRLAADGHRVTVFTARYDGAAADERIEGVRYRRRGGHLTVFLWAALMLLGRRFGKVDAVLEIQNGMPFLARLFTRARVVVLVHHVHREQWPVAGRALARIGWFMESRVAVRVNAGLPYLAVSDVTRQELVALGVAAKDIKLAWNGCQPVPPIGDVRRAEAPTLVVLGRLVPHKQVEHAIRAAAALRDDFPDLRLRVVGSGWWHEELQAEVERLGVADLVTFTGHVGEVEKYRELASAWLHLLPSLKEGWGLSIIEAAQVAVPSIAYRSAGGVRDSILDGVTGLLARDEAHFVELTRHLLADPLLREELGAKARARTAEFTWEATTSSVTDALLPPTPA